MALKKLREMLDSKEISAVELTEQYLDRIEKSDKEINSYITVCKENALADAKKAQEVIDSGNSGAFTGLPISVKDNICTLGVKTTCASHMLDDFIPPYNATVMEKLKKDNIVMLLKNFAPKKLFSSAKQIWTNLQWVVLLKHHISAVLKTLTT